MSVTASLEARLQRLEDLEEIRQLFIDYGRHLDACNFAAYAELFADDGEVLLGPMGRARGREDIRALMEKALSGRQGSSYHLITSPTIQLGAGGAADGDPDRATSEVLWTVIVRRTDGQPALTMTGRHRDTLVRERGRWRFLRREGLIDIPSRYGA